MTLARASGLQALLFLQLASNALALQRRQIVDEQFALQMIYFMLKANCQQAIQLPTEALSLTVQGGHFHTGRPTDCFVKAGHRQAALVILTQFGVEYFYLGIR